MAYYIAHSGIKGQKWGIRRYQYEDGSLTPAGKVRYAVGRTSSDGSFKSVASVTVSKRASQMSTSEIEAATRRKKALAEYKSAGEREKENERAAQAKNKAEEKKKAQELKAAKEKEESTNKINNEKLKQEKINTSNKKIDNDSKSKSATQSAATKFIADVAGDILKSTIKEVGKAALTYEVKKAIEKKYGKDVASDMFNQGNMFKEKEKKE